ncbi:MAG TPA: sulfotransferase [Xanthomonadaceae bacterium]|nr:sulfotransferase [Xanthomonadaceae bacterium]
MPDREDAADQLRDRARQAARAGDMATAAAHMAEACRRAPTRGDLQFQLGSLLAHAGRFEEALRHFRAATALTPGSAEAWLFQGRALAGLGRNAEALRAFRDAYRIAPADPRILDAVAEAEFMHGWPADALPLWASRLTRDPMDTHARLRTAESLARTGDQDGAVVLYREGVRLLPDSDALWLALGQAEEDCGRRDAARAAYEQALALHPDWPFALACLVGMLRGEASDALLARAGRVHDAPATGDADRALLGYALGKAHDARGDHACAMDRWAQANAARRRVAGEPDPAAWDRRIDRIIDTFPSGCFAQPAADASDDGRFVFIVGMPRSGTTLTEQLLASHPLVHACGELPDMAMVARELGPSGLLHGAPAGALLAPGALASGVARYHAAATRHAPADAKRLVDKEPTNFLHLGLVALMFPRARVVWCRRDPRDVAVSIFGENFALEETWATRLDTIGTYIRGQERLMRHWQAVLPLPILEFPYEALVGSTESGARAIVDFAGLPWDRACLDFHDNARAVQSPSRWQVRQPVHTRSVGRWRNYEAHLGPLLEALEAPAS